MTLVQLRLTLPEGTWAGDVSRSCPEATFRVLAAMPGPECGYELVSVHGTDDREAIEALDDHDGVGRLEVVQRSDAETTVQFTAERAPIVQASKDAGLPLELPFRIEEGRATVELVGSRSRVSAFGLSLEEADIDYEVELITRRRHLDQLLTETQEELLTEAIERGYYETPRRCTLTELAEAAGIAKSTCSETLQRAEESVMNRFMDELSADGTGGISA